MCLKMEFVVCGCRYFFFKFLLMYTFSTNQVRFFFYAHIFQIFKLCVKKAANAFKQLGESYNIVVGILNWRQFLCALEDNKRDHESFVPNCRAGDRGEEVPLSEEKVAEAIESLKSAKARDRGNVYPEVEKILHAELLMMMQCAWLEL